jgi:diguanylate cyclase (GGDEF)-like protein
MLISIENSRLYHQAITDVLTNANNRAFFDNFIILKVNEARKYNKKLGLIMLDIDFFKKINDNYGHQAGDRILKRIVEIIQDVLRQNDLLARYGGEEFVVVLPETDIYGTGIIAEKIRTAIENDSFYIISTSQDSIKVTVSIGVAEYEDKDDRISLIEKADKNLYIAKNNGRNRVAGNKVNMSLV